MSVANDLLTDVLSKLGTQLGATFRELPDLFNEKELSNRELENGYSAILLGGNNGTNQVIGQVTITRQLVIKITYRTYTNPTGSRTKTVLSTLYSNEEAIIDLFLKYPNKPTGFIAMLDDVDTDVETLDGEDDKFLVNTITFNAHYRFAYT